MTNLVAAQAHPDQAIEYPPRRARSWLIATYFFVGGVAIAWSPARTILTSKTVPDLQSGALLVVACLGLGFGVWAALAAIRGLPRLSASATGVEFRTMFAITRAEWRNLLPFQATSFARSLFNRPIRSASARIVGVAGKPQDSHLLVIPNAFRTPIDAIFAELNARRDHASGPPNQPAPEAADAVTDWPWATIMLLGLIGLMFMAEQFLAVTPRGPLLRQSATTLRALGGLSRDTIITEHEWFRLLTSAFLHLDLKHLVANGIALFIAGVALERLVGHWWLLALFILGAIGGSLVSVATSSSLFIETGASGGVMAMVTAIIVASCRLPDGVARVRLQMRSYAILVIFLAPLAASTARIQADQTAHIGSALVGAAAAMLLLLVWRPTERLPRWQPVAKAIATVGILIVIAGSVALASQYGNYRDAALLIPAERMPKNAEEGDRIAAQLVAEYPSDPRSHQFLGLALYKAHDRTGAEREFRASLREMDRFRPVLGRQVEILVHVMAAIVLLNADKPTEAREVARVACDPSASRLLPAQMLEVFSKTHLCDE